MKTLALIIGLALFVSLAHAQGHHHNGGTIVVLPANTGYENGGYATSRALLPCSYPVEVPPAPVIVRQTVVVPGVQVVPSMPVTYGAPVYPVSYPAYPVYDTRAADAGTVVGAIVGAVAGGNRHRVEGALIGAAIGRIIGSEKDARRTRWGR